MARPIKKGLDYFPLDVFLTGSVEDVECVYGAIGVYVIISLWKRIYAQSYYYKYDGRAPFKCSKEFGNQLELCFPKKNKLNYEIFDEIVRTAVELGVFDKDMFERYSILTSKTIQENYLAAKRKDAAELIDERYLLINVPQNRVFVAKTPISVAKTPINTETIPQSKVKESRVDKIIVDKRREKETARPCGTYKHILLTDKQYEDLTSEFGDKAVDDYISRVDEYCESSGKTYSNYAATISRWIKADREKEKRESKFNNSKFNNYQSENDYENLEERLLDNLLKEDGE